MQEFKEATIKHLIGDQAIIVNLPYDKQTYIDLENFCYSNPIYTQVNDQNNGKFNYVWFFYKFDEEKIIKILEKNGFQIIFF